MSNQLRLEAMLQRLLLAKVQAGMDRTPRPDWRAYYRRFCEAHGQPLMHGGLQLFPDGWRYAAASYEGPEYPPPDDDQERHGLVRAYHQARLRMVEQERQKLEKDLAYLERMRDSCALPIPVTVTSRGDDGKARRETRELSLDGLKQRLEWLKEDAIKCRQVIKELSNETFQDVHAGGGRGGRDGHAKFPVERGTVEGGVAPQDL